MSKSVCRPIWFVCVLYTAGTGWMSCSSAAQQPGAADIFSGQWTGTWHNSLNNTGRTKLTLELKGGSIAGQWDDLAVQNATRNGAQLKWECNDTVHKRQYWMEFNVVSPGKAKLTYKVKGVTNEYRGWVDDYVLGEAAASQTAQKALSVTLSPAEAEVDPGEKFKTAATATGGVPPYRYEWHNADKLSEVTSSGANWTLRSVGPREIKVDVTDAGGSTAQATARITVRGAAGTETASKELKSGQTPTPTPAPQPEPPRESTKKTLETMIEEARKSSSTTLERFPAIRIAEQCSAAPGGAPWGKDAKETEGTVRLETYRASVAHALRNFKVVYGRMSEAQSAGLDKMWAPFFGYPSPAAAAWFARLNPLMDEYVATAAALEGSFPAFQDAMTNVMIAMGTQSRRFYAASAPAAAMHYARIQASRKRLDELAKAIGGLGDAPNPIAAQCEARARHAKALGGGSEVWTLLHRTAYVAAGLGGPNGEFGYFHIATNSLKVLPDLKWNGTEFSYSATIPDNHPGCGGIWSRTELHGELSKDGTQVRSLSGTRTSCSCLVSKGDNDECERFGPKQATLRFPGARVTLYQDKPVLGGPERVRVLFTNASRALELDPKPPEGQAISPIFPAVRVQDGDVYLQFTNYLVNKEDTDKWMGSMTRVINSLSGGQPSTPNNQVGDVVATVPAGPPPSTPGGATLAADEQAQAVAEAIAQHEALAKQDEQNAARWAADALKEKDPKIREELERRAREIAANASAEHDIANSLRTGTLVRTPTEWDRTQQTAILKGIHEELTRFDGESHSINYIGRGLPQMDPAQARALQDRMEAAMQSPNRTQDLAKIEAEVRQFLSQGMDRLEAEHRKADQELASAETKLAVAEGVEKAASAAIMIGALAVPGVGSVAMGYSMGTGLVEGGPAQALVNGVRMYSPYIDVAAAAYEGAVKKDPKTGAYGGAWGAFTNAAWTAGSNYALSAIGTRLQGAVAKISREAAGAPNVKPPEIEGFQSTEWRYEQALKGANTPAERAAVNKQFDVVVQRQQMKQKMSDALATADKRASAARRPDGSVDTTHPDYQKAVEQLKTETAKIKDEYGGQEGRDLVHEEALEAAKLNPGEVFLSGSKPKNALSDMDVSAVSFQKGKAYVKALQDKGLHVVEYGDRWVVSNDTTVWKPAAGGAVGSSSYEAQVIHGALRGSDKFATQSGQNFTKGQESCDKLGAVIDNFKKAGEAGLGSESPKDLHVIGKSVDKALGIAAVESVPGLKKKASALRDHQLPEEAGIVTLGASKEFKAREMDGFLNSARQGIGEAYKSAAKQSAAFEADLLSQKQAAIAKGDMKTASAIQKQLAIVRVDNRLAYGTVADANPGLFATLPPPEGTVTPSGTLPEPMRMGWTPLLATLQSEAKTEGQATVQFDPNDPVLKAAAERCKLGVTSVDQKLKSARAGTEEARHLTALKGVLQSGVTNPALAIQQTRQLTGYELAEVLRQLGAQSGK